MNFPKTRVYISPLEIQIPYKLYLGSPKDIEDAVYLWELFRNDLDITVLKEFLETLGIGGDEYGILV